jgi:hypothetical protein
VSFIAVTLCVASQQVSVVVVVVVVVYFVIDSAQKLLDKPSYYNSLHFSIIILNHKVHCQWYSTGLLAGWSGVRVSAGAGNFSLHHRVQTDSGSHPASYPLHTRGSFPGGQAAGS